ncbi:TIGR04149 family rSAM-modified RiPP [Pedobacter sp. Hv1]|uniref:TIGR04149 family rSAM-modified RiPP n=1 Tax=Pedobacter sp. Hv1 TaxID=1740090 RepID=UPI0006D89623|nr:TIGR04149 family rSAM-modified RiPP [Pedobacter sp. Hv1]KQB98622.1 hypothetical protein AQF98_21520 [Pedobacter sp. Hv1]
MKKINLKNLSMDEVLTKSELKKIIGGDGSGCQEWSCFCPGQGAWGVTTCSPGEIDDMLAETENNCPHWGAGCSLIG